MNILITGNSKFAGNKEYTTLCYNTLKRNEEDLRRRIPKLKDLNLIVRPTPAVMHFNPKNLCCDHLLSEDQSSLTITFGFRSEPAYNEIIKAVELELTELKKIYD